MFNKLTSLLLTSFLFLACNYQNDPKDLGNGDNDVKEVQLNKRQNTEVQNEQTEEVITINENGEEVVLKKVSVLKDLELFDLLDIFFSKFVVPVNADNEALDTLVDYENLHILNKSGNRLYAHLVDSIEKKMNEIDLSDKSNDFKVAFYINAYNYSAIRVINNNYERNGRKIKSIKDLSGSIFNPFKIFSRKFIGISGTNMSLDDIEKTEIKNLLTDQTGRIDARFHFAVICASGGCPVTLNRAYREETLDEDLTFITTEGLKIPRILRRDGNTLYLSKIISEWYSSDFVSDSGSIQNFLSEYGVQDTTGRIQKLGYDWDLNILTTPRETPTLPELESISLVESTSTPSEVTDLSVVTEEEEQTECRELRRYKLTHTCTDIIASNSPVEAVKVCIYKKQNSNKFLIKQTASIDGSEESISHKFKSKENNFQTIKQKRLLGILKKDKVSFSFAAGVYSYKEAKESGVELSATCLESQE